MPEDCISMPPDVGGPPRARREDVVQQLAGRSVADPYRWLEDCASPEVEAWQSGQDAWARRALDALGSTADWMRRIRAWSTAVYRGLPRTRGDTTFFLERGAHDDRARLCVHRDGGSPARTLVSPASLDGAAASLGEFWPSPGGDRVVYQLHRHNRDDAELHVLTVEDGQPSEHALEGGGHTTVVWLPGGSAFLYVHQPATGGDRFGRATVRLHRVGERQSADRVLYGPSGDAQTRLELRAGTSGGWVFLLVHRGFSANDVLVGELLPEGCSAFRPLVTGSSGRNQPFEHLGRVYLHSDVRAPRGSLRSLPLSSLGAPRWVEIVGEREDELRAVRPCGSWLCLEYLEHASSRVELYTVDGVLVETRTSSAPSTAAFDAAAASDVFFFTVQGFASPRRVLRVDAHRHFEQWFASDLEWDDAAYEVHRLFASAPDGARVPVFVMRHRDATPRAPTMLEAYGGFGIAISPFFSPAIAAWLERGGQYAFACTRGGGEYGSAWHAAGRGRHKENVFVDFIAAAELLLGEGYCEPGRLGIAGESNGGLLVAAVLNRRPDLFSAALSQVPIADMIGFARYEPYCIPEYGSPEDPDDLRVLLSYCPCRNVRADVRMPPVLVTLVPGDERAHPMHARKWVAALQRAHPNTTVLLRVHGDSGHRGPAELDRRISLTAEGQAFLWHHLASPGLG